MKRLIIVAIFLISATSIAFAQYNNTEKQSWLGTFATNISPVTRTADGSVDYAFTAILGTCDVLQYVDLAFTYNTFTNPPKDVIAVEANIIFRPFVKNLPALIAMKTGQVILVNYLLKGVYEEKPSVAYVTAGGLTLAYGLIVRHQFQLSVEF